MNLKAILAGAMLAVAITPSVFAIDDAPRITHAIYAVESEWQSHDDVAVPELDDFDFVYVMAAPKWIATDFDLTSADINAKYVVGHNYAHPEGMKALIEGVHSRGGKILCSFPGREFIDIAPNPKRADRFAEMMAAFVAKYDYDGVEVDWEHTVTEPLHLDFMKRIRRELTKSADGKQRYWLTTALHDYRDYTPEMAAELSKTVDWINIMFYDMGGGIWGTVATHNSPLDQMEKSYESRWQMFDPAKIHIGMPNYGFYYKGIKPGEKVPEGKTLKDYGRYCNYTDLPALLKMGWTEVWDETAQCPYYISPDGNEFITLESPHSLDKKLEWVRSHKFGGIFWWEYSCDWEKPTNKGERGRHLLTDHISLQIR